MHRTSRRLAVVLIASLLWVSEVDAAAAPQTPALSEYVIRNQVELFGPGLEVKLKLAGGGTLLGSIGTIDRESFELISKRNHDHLQIAYRMVVAFEAQDVVFHESSDMDVQVRRVVNQLGVGRHIQVKTPRGKVHGNVQRTWDDHFELLLDKKWNPIDVAYADVQELSLQSGKSRRSGGGPSMGKAIVISFAFILIIVLPVQCSLRKDCHI